MINKIALVPAYEPDEKLIKLVKELKDADYKIVVVDDGSGENYKKIFHKCNKMSHVISYMTNMGKGYALKKGLEYIKKTYKKDYYVVTLDSDGQHTVEDANHLIEYCKDNKSTLVIGKRIRSEKTPLRSRIGNSITRFVFRKVSDLDIYDTQTGLRAFSSKLTDYLLDIEGERYEYELNVLLKCAKDKVPIKEIEIETIYIDNNSGSHFNTIKDSYRIYRDIFKFSRLEKKKINKN